jgi:hypothetical protein
MSTAPCLATILAGWWGDGFGSTRLLSLGSLASNILVGTNPAYTVTDFAGIYPNFLGPPTPITATVTAGSPNLSVSSTSAGLAVGQLVTGPGIAGGAVINSINGATIVLSANATASGASIPLNVYTTPFVPLLVLNIYINLATNSLAQKRWHEAWPAAIAMYAAHFATMWLQSEGNPAMTPGQAAAAGLQNGILVSKSVDGVSAGYENSMGEFADWGAWTQTKYGAQLITLAELITPSIQFVW